MIGKPAHLCFNCMSREICPLRGRPCDGWDNPGLFRGLLKMISPNTDWDGVFEMLEKNRKLGGDGQ